MTNNAKGKLTLDKPATYQIRVPGRLEKGWLDWAEEITITVETKDDSPPITILFGTIDQAALHGLLRRLCSFGLPLISVTCVDFS